MSWYQHIIKKGHLKIGGHTVRIKEVEPNALSENDTCGATELDENLITISKELPQTHKEATLIHEILHIVNWKMSELDIEYLAQALYLIIHDNSL